MDISQSILQTNGDDCLDTVFLSTTDQVIFLFGGSIAILASSFLIIGYFRFKKLRKQPGDLILGISISDLILSIQWIILALFPEDVNDSAFCTTIGLFGTFAGYNEYMYNVMFCIYLIVSLKNALTQSKIPRKFFHIFNIGFSVLAVIFLYLKGDIGKTLFGTCSIKSSCSTNGFSMTAPLIALAYICLAGYTYYYIKKKGPVCMRANKQRAQFLEYYLRYIFASSFFFMLIGFTQFVYVGLYDEGYSDAWLQSFGNASKLCIPLVLSFVRYKDPLIQGVMRRVIFCKSNKPNQAKIDPKEASPLEKFATKLLPFGEDDNDEDEDFILKELQTTRKIELTYTLLSCVYYAQTPTQNIDDQISLIDANQIYKQTRVFMIDRDIFIKKIDEPIRNELKRVNINILNGTLKVYAPDIFNEFVRSDSSFINIKNSLDFFANKVQIEKASGADGGKSGEFFFFSHDRKLIIKTIPDVEKDMMIKILEKYHAHWKKYPDSIISKAYGLFTYESTELGLKFNIIVTKNVCGFPSEFVLRTYDMKGSTHDREVMRNSGGNSDLKGKVLKDIDFDHFDKKIYADRSLLAKTRNQLMEDSKFFKSVDLIDYSLVVFIVEKKKYFEKYGTDAPDFTALNPLASLGFRNPNRPGQTPQDANEIISSFEDNGFHYNIGIIDYLQPYNIQKLMEKNLKKCKKMDRNLDTSSQDPHTYSERFSGMVVRITTGT